MKNTKEIQAILTAIFCINQVSENRDPDIAMICEYAFRRLMDANTNLLALCCIKRTKEDLMPEINELLDIETQFTKYMKV